MDGPASIFLKGDPMMLGQAILNLINNALIHGGPTLTKITLDAQIHENMSLVTVTDYGKGIDHADFERALNRFSQVGPSAGSGLGHPIATALSQTFNGRLALDRKDGFFSVKM